MNNAYALRHPVQGWFRVSWPELHRHPESVARCLEQIANIPGVSIAPRGIDLPGNVLTLAAVLDFFDAVEIPGVSIAPRGMERGDCPEVWSPSAPLFEHQRQAAAHALGARGMLLADAMGLGKTRTAITAAETWLRDTGIGSCIIIAPLFTRATWLSELLVTGAISSPDEFSAVETLDFHDGSFNPWARYYFCHYGLARFWGSRFWMNHARQRPQVAILDECFAAGTCVATPDGWRSIETFEGGEQVIAHDGSVQPVLAVWVSEPQALVEVAFKSQRVYCTPNHPFLTTRGWVCADALRQDDEVVHVVLQDVRGALVAQPEPVLQYALFGAMAHVQTRSEDQDASDARQAIRSNAACDEGFTRPTPRQLEAHVREQPDAARRRASETIRDAACDGASTSVPGWQRTTGINAASEALGSIGLAVRADRQDRRWLSTKALQDRHREPEHEGSCRGGWWRAQELESPSRRCAQDAMARGTRVVGVSRLERGRAPAHIDDRRVYNLSVGGPQTYVIDGGLVVHNCHWVKNGRVKRSEATRVIAQQCPFRILLTGTPLENRVAELWHPLTILGGTHSWGSPVDFRRRYAGAYRGTHGWVDTEVTNVDEFRTRLRAVGYLRRTADDVGLDLPPFTRQTLAVDLSAADQRAHDAFVRGDLDALVTAILEHRAGPDALEILTVLRKITSRAKLKTTTAYVENALEQGESVVVFVWEREIAAQLAIAFHTAGHVAYRVTGEVTPAMRETAIDNFQAHGGVLVATLDALKEGVTLHKARIVVLHDLDWRPTAILQAEKRIHRIGQHRACQSVWVVGVRTVDTVLARHIIAKARQAAEALNIVDGADAVDELGLADAVGLESFEDRFARLVDEWRAQ